MSDFENGLEPRQFFDSGTIGNGVRLQFKGDQFKGSPILDTSVMIGEDHLCSITWSDKRAFLEEINSVIDKYRI